MNQFDFLKDVSALFDSLSNKDQKYKKILEPIQNQYAALSAVFLDYENEHQKVVNQSKASQQATLDDFTKQLRREKENNKLQKKDFSNDLLLLKTQISEQLKKDKIDLVAALDDLSSLAKNTDHKHQSNVAHNNILKQRELSAIDQNIAVIKKESNERIAILEDKYREDISVLTKETEQKIEELNIKIHQIKNSLAQSLEQINQEKNAYRKQSDDNYLSIKNVYYQASTSFNKKIDSLKGKRAVALARFQTEYRNNLTPIEEQIKLLEQNYQKIKQITHQDLTNTLTTHHQKLEVILQEYDKKKEILYADSSEAVSVINGKLASFREKIIEEKSYENKKLNLRIKGLTIKEKNYHKAAFNKFVRSKDKELNDYIKNTLEQTRKIQQQLYLDLLELDNDFIDQKCGWRIGRAILELEYRQSLANIDFQYQHKLKESDIALKKEKLQFDYQLALLEINYLSDIAPLESQLNIGNAIQEREINLLTNDTAYHLAYFTYQENLKTNQSHLLELEIELERSHTKSLYEFMKNSADISIQLQLEKENVIRDAAIKKESLRKELFSLSSESAIKTSFYDSILAKNELENKEVILKSKNKLLNEYLASLVKEKERFLQLQLNFADATYTYKENLFNTNQNIMQNTDELNIIHSRINLLYNQLFSVYHINHTSLIQSVNFYHLPAHPEDFKNLLSSLGQLASKLEQTQEDILEVFSKDIRAYHEQKINQLTGYSFDSSLATLNEEFESERNKVVAEKNNILAGIKHYENLMVVNHSKIDLHQNQINTLERRANVDKNKLTLRHLEQQIRGLKRDIKNIEKNSATLDDAINKASLSVTIYDNRLNLLFENHKDAINKLRVQQRKDAAIYFEQLALYQSQVAELKRIIKNYYSQLKVHSDRLLSQLYLIDQSVNSYVKKVNLIETLFEKDCLKIYQSLLNVGMRLYHSLDNEQHNSLKSIEYHFNLLSSQFDNDTNDNRSKVAAIEAKYISSLAELETSGANLLNQANNVTNKELLPQINGLRSEISRVENEIGSLDSKTDIELSLIETNLQSVLSQYQEDYANAEDSQNSEYKKQTNKLNSKIAHDTTSINEHEVSTAAKNDSLLERFQATYNKLLAQLNDTQKKYDLAIQRENNNKEKNLEGLNRQIEISKKILVQNQKNINKQSVLDIKEINKKERHDAKHEFADAKKSHRFKTKALKL